MKGSNETYSQVIHRALAETGEVRDEYKSRLDFNTELLQELCGVVGQLAQEQGIPEEDLPGNITQRSKLSDPTNMFSLPKDLKEAVEEEDN